MYTRALLELCQGAKVPDLIGPECRLLFVGINPGLQTAATGLHFAHPSNRFYPALRLAGIIEREIVVDPPAPAVDFEAPGEPSHRWPRFEIGTDPTTRLEEDRRHLTERGIGITNLADRATARASELTTTELLAGGERLRAAVDRYRPRVVAVAGITAYRTAFRRPKAVAGRQEETFGVSALWVVPNPSGLNAHETVDTLADAYRLVAVEAGVLDR